MTTKTTDRPPVTPARDWNAWLAPKDGERHRLCVRCHPIGTRGRVVTRCGEVRTSAGVVPYNPASEVCDICQQAVSDRLPCPRCGHPATP